MSFLRMNDVFQRTLNVSLQIDEANYASYLKNVINILSQYSWVYEVRNVDIFIFNVLERIPEKWVEALVELPLEDICQLPFGYLKDEWPSSLKDFVLECYKLSEIRFPKEMYQDRVSTEDNTLVKKITDKKYFETQILSHLINEVCQAVNSNVVLDIGAGQGHLSRCLHRSFGICSIALDSASRFILKAQEILNEDLCQHSIKYHTVEVQNSESCLRALKTILEENKNLFCVCDSKTTSFIEKDRSSSVIMVGLHSCGNLTQDMMKLFCKLEEAVAFVGIGCCYNKTKLEDFPMSKVAESAITACQKINPGWNPCVSGLRLASHLTRSPDSNFVTIETEKNLFYRATFEYFLKRENYTWHKRKRHIRQSDLCDFWAFCTAMFRGGITMHPRALKSLEEVYKEKEPLFKRVKILLVLQMLLQPLWETFILLDRVMYFEENNITAKILAMWDDSISPRNLAICAYKK